MLYCLSACIFVLFLGYTEGVTFINAGNAEENLQVATTKGIVQGRQSTTYNGLPYWSYTGIPYAKPPLGNLRLRGPKPAISWPGVLDATKEGPACVEIFIREKGFFTAGEEDCLYVNVFTPQDPKSIKEHLPVMVWFYGGGFVEGNSSTKYFGPDNLIEQDVIVITFNYRVGLFGFLSTGDAESPGNYGLKDQNLLLRWVQENIKYFGGDKNKVTIFGQSAGAASAFYHLVSPRSKGLFHRVIANSGTSLSTFAYRRNPREIAFQVGSGLGISTKSTKDLVTLIRKADVDRLTEISKVIVTLGLLTLTLEGNAFSPVIEPKHKHAFISESTYTLMENGNFPWNFNRVPVLTGINSLEAIFLSKVLSVVKLLSVVFAVIPELFANPSMNIRTSRERREVGIQIQRHYFRRQWFFESTEDEALNYISDDQFVRPARKSVQLISRYTPVYFYLFDYNSDYGLKGFEDDIRGRNEVSHGEELPFIWKREMRPAPKGLDRLMVLRMVKFYTNFAKTGNPTPSKDDLFENITWPKVNSAKNIPYMNIGAHLSIGQNFREDHMLFWDKLYEDYGHKPYFIY